jgi:hypothetical protein
VADLEVADLEAAGLEAAGLEAAGLEAAGLEGGSRGEADSVRQAAKMGWEAETAPS